MPSPTSRLLPFLVVFFFGAGCAEPDVPVTGMGMAERPSLETRADSVAMTLYDALGGPQAWAALPALRFDFAVERGGQTRTVARHLWNRQTGNYRVEWSTGEDTTYVALFNVAGDGPSDGAVYLGGTPVEDAEGLMEQAYQRFINDTYWLLAPVKVFDPGVRRSYAADSSGGRVDVIATSFDDVGLTPGDRYWLYVDRETGRLERWAFHLQGMDAEAPARTFEWTGYEELPTPRGPVRVATVKRSVDGASAIRTPVYPTDGLPADSMFARPQPMLDS